MRYLFGGVLGALFGVILAAQLDARINRPGTLDPEKWSIVSPDRPQDKVKEAHRFLSQVVDGALLLAVRVSGSNDKVLPVVPRPAAGLKVVLVSESAPLNIMLRDAHQQQNIAVFRPTGWSYGPLQPVTPYATPSTIDLRIHDGSVWLDGRPIVKGEPGIFEFHAPEVGAQIKSVTVYDTDGAVMMDEAFELPIPPLRHRAGWSGLGSVFGVAVALVSRGRRWWVGLLRMAAATALPMLAWQVPYSQWAQWNDKMYLEWPPYLLRVTALGLSLIPLLGAALLDAGVLQVPSRRRSDPHVAWGLLIALGVAWMGGGTRDFWGLALAGWVGLPWWTAWRAGLSRPWTLVRDLPALAGTAVSGVGLLPAILWRLLCVYQDVPRFLERNPRAGVDALLLTLLALPVGLETALRALPATDSWRPSLLQPEWIGPSAEREPFWTDRCGDARYRIYGLGGSSTGSAHQMRNPADYWVGRLHARLCAANIGAATFNYGGGGIDTFEIAAFTPSLFEKHPPSVVIVYSGVNDVLTRERSLTRKQTAAAVNSRSDSLKALDAFGAELRLVVGLSLLRPPTPQTSLVSAVPVADAKENLQAVITEARRYGAAVVLVTEWVEAPIRHELTDYAAMSERLAADNPGTVFFDPFAVHGGSDASMFYDYNHLTVQGADTLAADLAPLVEKAVRDGVPPR